MVADILQDYKNFYNMIIHNSDPQYIFVAVPKTGTTTIQNFMRSEHVIPELATKKCKWLIRDYHLSIAEILEKYSIPNNKSYFKFAFHRNPWDRMVSFWHDYTTDRLHLTWAKQMLDYKNFETFVLEFANSKWRHHKNFKPTVEYTHIDGKQAVDKIGLYDNFESDIKFCFDKINLSSEKFSKTKKLRRAPREKNYKKYYTNEKMIQAVADTFVEDIKLFGDKFD
jgi:chondroitin 4-sulfotransferase 11